MRSHPRRNHTNGVAKAILMAVILTVLCLACSGMLWAGQGVDKGPAVDDYTPDYSCLVVSRQFSHPCPHYGVGIPPSRWRWAGWMRYWGDTNSGSEVAPYPQGVNGFAGAGSLYAIYGVVTHRVSQRGIWIKR